MVSVTGFFDTESLLDEIIAESVLYTALSLVKDSVTLSQDRGIDSEPEL